jgi:integrase
MVLKRERLIFQNGERYACLVDKFGVPDFWTTLFLTTHYRSSSAETMRSVVNVLAHFYVWDGAQKRCFYQRVLEEADAAESLPRSEFKPPVFFTVRDAQSLARHCKLTTAAARRRLYPKRNKIVSFVMDSAATVAPDPVVSTKYQRDRLTIISSFLNFIVDNALRHYSQYVYYLEAGRQMVDLINKQRSKKRGSTGNSTDPDKKAPRPEVFDEILYVAHPLSESNPFTTLVRDRNYLLVKILYDTGMRVGELLQLKVEDINLAGAYISIVRRHDDPEDIWRAIEPNAKTNERDIPIQDDLVDLIRCYIVSERRRMVEHLPKRKRHGFLFVSNKITTGQPMSIKQLSNLIMKISKDKALAYFIESKGIVIKKRVSPHSYRHNRNNQISTIIDAVNETAREEGRLDDIISEKEEKDIRMYLMGHSSPKSAQVYTLRHTKKIAEKINLKLAEKENEILKDDIPLWRCELDKAEMKQLVDRVLSFCS